MNHRNSSKKDLLSEMDAAWEALNATLRQLTDKQMTVITDGEGWSVKDHLSHLAAWERSVIFYLENQPRSAGLGVDSALLETSPIDAVNREIFKANRNVPLQEVRAGYQAVHQELKLLLASLDEEDLTQPSARFTTGNPGDSRLAYDIIAVNTFGHIAEHLGWMENLVRSSSR